MQILALETIERQGTLATLSVQQNNCELVKEVSLPEKERTACTLLPQINYLLKGCSWDVNDLDLICVATGPGSFTGLRIGITTAKALAYSTRANLVGVHSLSVLAKELSDSIEREQNQRVWAILDAQRQELFAASFSLQIKKELTTSPETQLLGIDEWLEMLAPGDIVTGPPLKDLADQIPTGINIADSQLWSPTARAVGKLGEQLFRNNGGTDPMQLVPNYYRKSAAEEKAESTT